MKKGDTVFIPILPVNTSKEIWGPDAKEFKYADTHIPSSLPIFLMQALLFRPERWASPPERSADVPGVFSHLSTFLAGPRACIGHRFAVVE